MNGSFRKYHILAPLALLYRTVTSVRNRFYDSGLFKSHSFPFPVISIGNITVGGTGKTPHTQYLVSLLGAGNDIAVLSRGYGRCTEGFIRADDTSDSRTIGDEPLQIHTQFPQITVAVDEDRAHGLQILSEEHTPKAVILDDAFQHRRVTPSLNILLTDWNRIILDDMVMPAGRLRESASGRKRAHVIIVTKCPSDLDNASMERIASELAVTNEQKVFFSILSYSDIVPMCPGTHFPENGPVLALTGIAQPDQMVSHLKKTGRQVSLLRFPDHHRYDMADIRKIEATLDSMPQGSVIVTTCKDESRLASVELPESLRKRIFILPVNVEFIRDGQEFDRLVTNHVESFKQA